MNERWDVAMRAVHNGPGRQLMRINLPTDLAKPLIDAGYNRAVVILTPEGLLVQPYKGNGNEHAIRLIDVPEEWPTR